MTAPAKPGLDAFHKERSKCLDAFAGLEDAIICLLELTGSKTSNEPLSAKIDTLAKAKAGPRYSKRRKEQTSQLLPKALELAELRNDLVHSQLRLAVVDDEHWAQFTNVRQRQQGRGKPLQFTLEGLREFAKETQSVARDLADQQSKASSPPPPLPGAAGGP